jgi:hypothetical protein
MLLEQLSKHDPLQKALPCIVTPPCSLSYLSYLSPIFLLLSLYFLCLLSTLDFLCPYSFIMANKSFIQRTKEKKGIDLQSKDTSSTANDFSFAGDFTAYRERINRPESQIFCFSSRRQTVKKGAKQCPYRVSKFKATRIEVTLDNQH